MKSGPNYIFPYSSTIFLYLFFSRSAGDIRETEIKWKEEFSKWYTKHMVNWKAEFAHYINNKDAQCDGRWMKSPLSDIVNHLNTINVISFLYMPNRNSSSVISNRGKIAVNPSVDHEKKETNLPGLHVTRHHLAVKSPCQSHDQDDERPLDASKAHYRSRHFWTIHRFSQWRRYVGLWAFSFLALRSWLVKISVRTVSAGGSIFWFPVSNFDILLSSLSFNPMVMGWQQLQTFRFRDGIGR